MHERVDAAWPLHAEPTTRCLLLCERARAALG